MTENKRKKKRSITMTVSYEAHAKMAQEAFNKKPRLTLRELVNIKNDLPKDL